MQVSCLAGITPLVYAWEAQNTAGDTKRKCTSAVVLIGMCTGNVCCNPVGIFPPGTDMILQVIGPQLYSLDQAPEYRPGLISNLIMFVLVAIIAMYVYIPICFGSRQLTGLVSRTYTSTGSTSATQRNEKHSVRPHRLSMSP